MNKFHTIRTTGFYNYLNNAECMLIGRVADSNLLRVEIAGGKQIDLQDHEVIAPNESDYESRVRALEAEGMTRSDAQAVVDAEDMGGAS